MRVSLIILFINVKYTQASFIYNHICYYLVQTVHLNKCNTFTQFLQTVPGSCSVGAHEMKYSHWVTSNPLLRDYTNGSNKYVKLLYLFYAWYIWNKKYCVLHIKLVCSWITTFSIWDSQLTVGCSAADNFLVLVFLGCNSNQYSILKFMAIPWYTLQNSLKIKQVLLMRIFALMQINTERTDRFTRHFSIMSFDTSGSCDIKSSLLFLRYAVRISAGIQAIRTEVFHARPLYLRTHAGTAKTASFQIPSKS
jgi:hypothetical protein